MNFVFRFLLLVSLILFSQIPVFPQGNVADNSSEMSRIYLNYAYNALVENQLDSARKFYQKFKDLSGISDELFEEELSKAEGSYNWSLDDLKNKGFIVGCDEDHSGRYAYTDNEGNYQLTFTHIPGPDGKEALIEKEYGHMCVVYGKILNGFYNGICLLSSYKELDPSNEENMLYNNIYEIAYVKDGKIITPTIGVLKRFPTGKVEDYLKNQIFINHYGIRFEAVDLDEYALSANPMIEWLKKIYGAEILDHSFIKRFRLGDVDMDFVNQNFNKFMRSSLKIPNHVWLEK